MSLLSFVVIGIFQVDILEAGADKKSLISFHSVQKAEDPILIFNGMEITQGIQNMKESVKLIADKRTFVRAYLNTDLTLPLSSTIIGVLQLYHEDSGLDNISAAESRIRSLNSITFTSLYNQSTDVESQRIYANESLNFELPPNWITEGQARLEFQAYVDGKWIQLLCNNNITHLASACNSINLSRLVYFEKSSPILIRLFETKYWNENKTFEPRIQDVYHLSSWLKRIYPTANVDITNVLLPVTVSALNNESRFQNDMSMCMAVNSKLTELLMLPIILGSDWDFRTRSYALVSDGSDQGIVEFGSHFMRGCSQFPPGLLPVASGPTGFPGINANPANSFNWDLDSSYGDWYGSHEIAHMYNRSHVPNNLDCHGIPGQPLDQKYPYINGGLSGLKDKYVGYDPGDPNLGIKQKIYSPEFSSDIMSYGCDQWISDYTYEGIHHYLCMLDFLFHKSGCRKGNFTDLDKDSMSMYLHSKLSPDNNKLKLFILGTINLSKHTVNIDQISAINSSFVTPRPVSSPFSITIMEKNDRVLARYPFEPKKFTPVPNKDNIALISEVVPYYNNAKKIIISEDKSQLMAKLVSNNDPYVIILSPNGGQNFKREDTIYVKWSGMDYDDDRLTYSLLYSPNSGKSWQTVESEIKGSGYEINADKLQGSNYAKFRIIAMDGINTGIGDSDTFIVENKAPQSYIISPANNSKFFFKQDIVFNGAASDLEDGNLDGRSMRWISDNEHLLGYGRMVSATGFSAGMHNVTLVATDYYGFTVKSKPILFTMIGSH
jgi:hypothetical protein